VSCRLVASVLLLWVADGAAHVLDAQPLRRRAVISRPEPRGDWRRSALETMRVADAERLITDPAELDTYTSAGFNTLVLFDVNGVDESGTSWSFKSAEQIRVETAFARDKGLPLILGMAVEPFDAGAITGEIPAATDSTIRERLELWKRYGDDVVIGVFPWYDDVFWQTVDVERQRHVYRILKAVAADWYVFGMIGEFGFNATDDAIARHYDPAAFDHLIVLMYPYNIGGDLTGFPLDHIASADPDRDMNRYVDRFLSRMEERFFRYLYRGQLIVLVYQAFHYAGEPEGRIPRASDIAIMARRGSDRIREIPGQRHNQSAAYFYWGSPGSDLVGLSQREDWLAAVKEVHDDFEQRDRGPFQP
jgi:hypothetical protein